MAYLDYLNESVRSPAQELRDLQRANNFTDADLAANRSGRIAGGQVSLLIEQIVRPPARSFFTVAGWLLLVLVTAGVISAGLHWDVQLRKPAGPVFFERFFLFRGLYVVTFVRMFAAFMVISCAGGLAVALITAAARSMDLIRDAFAGKAAMIEGRVYAAEEECRGSAWDALREQWTRVRQERRKIYRYAIRDVALEVSDAGFRAISSGGHYKVYYAPRSELLLSIEPVSRGGRAPAESTEIASS